jgi:hypothetical protein
MKTLMTLIKELFMLVVLIGMADISLKVFFSKTLFGKLLCVFLKDIWISIRLMLKMTKKTGKIGYKFSKKAYKYLNSEYKKLETKQKDKKSDKKVVNGELDNVIDLKKFMAEKQLDKSR